MHPISNTDETRVAVTGHRGFIGRHLVTAFQVSKLRVMYVQGDVLDTLHTDEPFDVLCHLAGRTPALFARDPSVGFAVNLGGTLKTLALCRNQGARMVFASTSGVYSPAMGPVTEDHPTDPPTPYGQSKRLAERLCQAYAEHLGVPCVVLRLFNVYGSGQSENFVIPYLLRCALTGQMAVVYNRDSVRDFVHVKDVADAFYRACQIEAGWSVLNIGSGKSCTVRYLIDVMGQVLGRPLSWRQGSGRSDPQPSMWADVRRAEQEFGWRPTTGLADGLREVAEGMGVLVDAGWHSP